ncbi:hypothetical protein INP51_06335 [Blautia liquoris]|jgi:hypothetical protein|uniref:DUF551 domain-containing protein n=1 Tax=Blautia liquoris TaxID=2779518 RepID=A0A7M2RFK9_9FIRM|nr:hypothetical protein [Blautia liquoris]QOV18928.1 hypothetical protein INP51_13185 [Blautia liquoris]QOV19049.1 hypothetical protein INP51_13980 [Blautia liquoris]QOV20557.1 hypothetical protein INP51_06335 [Blautia liquoris]
MKWISTDERIPNTGERVLAKIRHHAWVSDFDSLLPDDQKGYHEEYVEICEAVFLDGEWTYRDGDCEYEVVSCTWNGVEILSEPRDEVIAWVPMWRATYNI